MSIGQTVCTSFSSEHSLGRGDEGAVVRAVFFREHTIREFIDARDDVVANSHLLIINVVM